MHFYLSVNVFRTKLLIRDAILTRFKSPNSDQHQFSANDIRTLS